MRVIVNTTVISNFASIGQLDVLRQLYGSDVAILYRTHGDKSHRSPGEVCTLSKPAMQGYTAELKERAVHLAVASEQPMAQTARDLGVKDNTLDTWIGKDHRVARQAQQGKEAQLYEERKRLRTAKTRFQEERAIFKKAAASCAPPLPCRTPGSKSSTRSFPSRVWAGSWRSHAVVTTHGAAGLPGSPLTPRSS